ncbi:hypothetical protein [Bradyrhizobium tropiciagri]|uniref:hypothetical protein n=1 Tax=Bradyrhizobium tropiciagri TaxID=312253 RepID=UPI00067AA0CD|nr:hypothetical protein [Bradyrhizobium tropiciagri]
MMQLPSASALEEDPLSSDVIKWVGDVSALLDATGTRRMNLMLCVLGLRFLFVGSIDSGRNPFLQLFPKLVAEVISRVSPRQIRRAQGAASVLSRRARICEMDAFGRLP